MEDIHVAFVSSDKSEGTASSSSKGDILREAPKYRQSLHVGLASGDRLPSLLEKINDLVC